MTYFFGKLIILAMEICYRTKELERRITATYDPRLEKSPRIKELLGLFFHIVAAATCKEDMLCFSCVRILPNCNGKDLRFLSPAFLIIL